MNVSKILPIEEILVEDRLRQVDENRAIAIAENMELNGQLQPVIVRQTNAGKKSYTLVDGAHRMRAMELRQASEISAIVQKLNKEQARLIEIDTLLMREEASALDRAIFLAERKRIYEALYPETKNGGDRVSDEAKKQNVTDDVLVFTEDVADKVGLGKRQIERAVQIASNLTKDSVNALRGTPEANNQSRLLKLARLEPEKQKIAVNIFRETRDLGDAIAQADGTKQKKIPDHEAKFAALSGAWKHAPGKARKRFVELVREELEAMLKAGS
jgi:ParB family chromosome partitioning protein